MPAGVASVVPESSLAPYLHRSRTTVEIKTKRVLVTLGLVLAVMAALAVLAVFWLTRSAPSLTEDQVRDALFTSIQREAPAAFLVTGRLELTSTSRVENSRVLLPGIVGLNLGTTRATVRVPGRVSYGFEVDSLRADMVRMLEDGTIEVQLPPLAVYSAEADLSRLEVETERGWARAGSLTDNVQQRAFAIVEEAMRTQALNHLRTSYQPRINAARALERILEPALRGLGMEDPTFHFKLGEDLVILPTG